MYMYACVSMCVCVCDKEPSDWSCLTLLYLCFFSSLYSLFIFYYHSNCGHFDWSLKFLSFLFIHFHTIKNEIKINQLLFKFLFYTFLPFNRQREKYREQYLPWALSMGKHMKPLMNVYWEKRWNQKIDDLRKQLNIEPFDVKWKTYSVDFFFRFYLKVQRRSSCYDIISLLFQ